MIQDEIEILLATLAPYEITHTVSKINEGKISESESHSVNLTVLPTMLEGQKIVVKVEDSQKLVPIEFLPRLILRFNFDLD